MYGIGINESKLEHAKSAGAISCATDLLHFSGETFDTIIDFAGVQATGEGAMAAVRPGGTVVLVGLASDEVTCTTMELVTKNVALKVSTSASIQELRDVFQLIARRALRPQIEQLRFRDIPKAVERLGSNEVQGRL